RGVHGLLLVPAGQAARDPRPNQGDDGQAANRHQPAARPPAAVGFGLRGSGDRHGLPILAGGKLRDGRRVVDGGHGRSSLAERSGAGGVVGPPSWAWGGSAGPPSSGGSGAGGRRRSRLYITGTKNSVYTVATSRPPMTARPSGAFCSPPSPRPSDMG